MSSARTDLCRGCRVTGIPTATQTFIVLSPLAVRLADDNHGHRASSTMKVGTHLFVLPRVLRNWE